MGSGKSRLIQLDSLLRFGCQTAPFRTADGIANESEGVGITQTVGMNFHSNPKDNKLSFPEYQMQLAPSMRTRTLEDVG
ncbi:hypothetical protein F9C07_9470 [Aspergillus flavus]|uniref:Uncharacterized protein n=1 Tax=Aspergillus flavus (strain ATCC 200026 / FGSC A1120 / IAM 13836 / NRRL 3357 / JCM 12722 / SRRC 167) TaxID=332952 RepID=A0A7U2MCP9_ASPFN|nr:hypothetical protein F9C07_9470 [Aspergillus flavus]